MYANTRTQPDGKRVLEQAEGNVSWRCSEQGLETSSMSSPWGPAISESGSASKSGKA